MRNYARRSSNPYFAGMKIFFSASLCAACTNLPSLSNVDTFVPYSIPMHGDGTFESVQALPEFATALSKCRYVAKNYRAPNDWRSIAQATITGGASNAAQALVPPPGLVPLLGAAAGGAGQATNRWLGRGATDRKIVTDCMKDEGTSAGLWRTYEPE